jgi:chemotaxis protein CheD
MREEVMINLSEQSAEVNPVDGGRAKIYLHPGQLFASADGSSVTTILGSCVALCLWDPVSRVGGINHYLLPLWAGSGPSSPRFGDVAVRGLIERVLTLGSDKRRLKAKLFGGACVIAAFRARENHLGMKNVQTAQQLLEQEGIPLVGHDVGGGRGRKLIFHTDDGAAWVKQL